MIRINQIKMPIDHNIEQLYGKAAKMLKINTNQIKKLEIQKKSIDARKKTELYIVYSLNVSVDNETAIIKKVNDKNMIRGGIAVALLGIIILALPLGKASALGLLFIGAGFGPIFPSVLHSVPQRFGSDYSADIIGYHMAGAYALGFFVQLSFGYIASWTTFEITPFVLMGLILLMHLANEYTVKKIK